MCSLYPIERTIVSKKQIIQVCLILQVIMLNVFMWKLSRTGLAEGRIRNVTYINLHIPNKRWSSYKKKTNLFYSFPISQPRIARLMPTLNIWGHINSRKLIYKIDYYFNNWDVSRNPILPTKKTKTGIIGTVKLIKELEQKPVTRYTIPKASLCMPPLKRTKKVPTVLSFRQQNLHLGLKSDELFEESKTDIHFCITLKTNCKGSII